MEQHKSFRLNFEGKWYEYIAGGLVLSFLGDAVAKQQQFFLYLGMAIGITGITLGLYGLGKGIKRFIGFIKK